MHQPGLYDDTKSTHQEQSTNNRKGPMIDYILAVDDPLAWHAQVDHLQTM